MIQRRLGVMLGAALLVVVPFLPFVQFQTNDDPFMLSLVRGDIYGHESSSMLFVSPILGEFLSRLYNNWPQLPWYEFIASVTMCASLMAVCSSSRLPWVASKTRQTIWVFLTVGTFLPFFLSFQFTQVAVLSAGVGTWLALSPGERKTETFGFILIVIGVLWRLEAGLLAVCSVVLSASVTHGAVGFRRVLRVAIPLVVGTTMFLLSWSSFSPLLNQQTRDFISLNTTRDQAIQYLTSSNDLEAYVGASARSGLSIVQLEVLSKWYFSDSRVWTESALREVPKSAQRWSTSTVVESVNSVVFKEIGKRNWSVSLFVVVLCLLSARHVSLRRRFTWLVFQVAILCAVLLAAQRLPPRLWCPLLIVNALWALGLNSQFNVHPHQKLDHTGTIGIRHFMEMIMIALVLLVGWRNLEVVRNNAPLRAGNTELNVWVDRPRPVVAFPDFYSRAFSVQPYKVGKRTNYFEKLVLVGSATRSPDDRQKISQLGLSEDLIGEISCGAADLGTDDSSVVGALNQLVFEATNVTLKWYANPVEDPLGGHVWRVANPHDFECP